MGGERGGGVPPPYTEQEAWINDHKVDAIRVTWKFTSEDSSQDYITLTAGDKSVTWMRETFDAVAKLTNYIASHKSLVEPKDYRLKDRIEARRAWEKREASDLAEFERLRKKLGK